MRVLRDGKAHVIPAKDIVHGDIVFLEAGDKINADIRLINAVSLFVDESVLTGESITVNKTIETVPESSVLADRTNMLFA